MIPLPFVIAGAVALSATALAFLLDRETEEERALHAQLRRRNAALRERAGAKAAADAREQAERRKRAAIDMAANLREYCKRYEQRLAQPAQEFRLLAERLKSDLADKSISPYRRNALRLLQGRVDATRNRLDAFLQYCAWYRDQLDGMLGKERYDAVLRFAEPSSRLPEDWYYSGKVGLVAVAELASTWNAYGQNLELRQDRVGAGFDDARQRAFMLRHPDQEAIPVQLFSSKNPRYFKACILRGALYVEHILEKLPCTAIVTRARHSDTHGDGYEVRCFPAFCDVDKNQDVSGGIAAFLPRAESSFPGKRYVAGEKLEVYLHYYDLLLSGSQVTVTQQRDALALGNNGAAPVFVHVDGARHDTHPLMHELEQGAAWQMRAVAEHGQGMTVTLQLGAWQVETEALRDCSQLRVTGLSYTGLDSVQLDQLPYPIRLIDQRIKDSVFCDALRFDEFLQFCRQQALFGADEEARRRAGVFFDRWSQVVDYLIEEEGYQTFALAPHAAPEAREWDCACAVDLAETLQRLIDKAPFPPRLFIEEQYVNRDGQRRWLQIGELSGVPEALGQGLFRLSHYGIQRSGPEHGYQPVPDVAPRLRYPNGGELANLGRQKRTLQAFMSGRLHNRALQQVLLMPERYTAQPDPFWSERVANGLRWQDPNWQDPAKAVKAKSILEAALVESNLYLIQGPPGTGKTTCIVELLHQLFSARADTRVLVVSQQNTAVDNALERFLKAYPEARQQILRISNDASKVHAKLQPNLTDTLLRDYLEGRQREYSASCISQPARAAWIGQWIDKVYRPQAPSRAQFDDELTELLVGDYPLVGATCVGLASPRYGMDRLAFDVCIVDEGGRSTVPELLIPLMRSRKVILIGDHYQLPPSVASRLRDEDAKEVLPFLEETFLKTSFFEQLYENLPTACRGRLNEQYRMVEPIGDLVADLFYSPDGVRDLYNGKVHAREHFLDPAYPLRWHHAEGRQEKENGVGPSLLNREEADAMLHFLRVATKRLAALKRTRGDDFDKKTVAIITPYGAQKRLIKSLLARAANAGSGIDEVMEIEVDTVDSFQGSEADIVLYSTVRTKGDISFLLDRQRLNVACSRARENLVFFGSTTFLREREARNQRFLFSTIIERSRYEHGERRKVEQGQGHSRRSRDKRAA